MSIKFKLPQMSLTMQEGTINKWVAEEGAKLKRNDVLLELETDKTTAELTSPSDGVLIKRMCKAGDVVPVGTVVCIIDDGSGDAAEAGVPEKSSVKPAADLPQKAETSAKGRKLISPLAARIAKEKNLDIQEISGTGPRGVIVKKDVLAAENALEAQTSMPVRPAEPAAFFNSDAYGPFKEEPFEGIRKATAENMMRSRMNTATLTTFVDVDMGNVKRMREFVKVTYTCYVVKAAANAIRDFPPINCSLIGDKIRFFEDANICVAVAAGDNKLVTPVIPKVDKSDIMTVNEKLAELADRAKKGELKLPDYAGGTFTVTNSGVFGSVFFTPIINYPQAAILGMGKTVETPVVKDGQIVIAPMMKLCLSYDHRLIDGATAVKFLVKVKEGLENPSTLIK